jgi:hypothetical protein
MDIVTLSHIAPTLVRNQRTRMQIGDHGSGRTDPDCRECATITTDHVSSTNGTTHESGSQVFIRRTPCTYGVFAICTARTRYYWLK